MEVAMISTILSLVAFLSVFVFLYRCRGGGRCSKTAVSYRRVRQKEGEEGRVNVLVTGAEGALASHVVEQLIKVGGYNVHCLDLRIPKEERRNHDVCSYIQTDITKYGDVESALEGMQAVFHVASITPIVDLFFSHKDYYRVNVTGTENIIKACKVCNVQRLVYTSTSAVTKGIGLNHPYTDESLPYPEHPLDIYAETKAAAEKLVLAASGRSGLTTCSLRPAGMLLTRRNPFIRYVMENRSVVVKNGNHGLSFVTADAAAIAHILAEQRLRGNGAAAVAAGKVYILANTEKVTYEDFFGQLVSDSVTIWGQPPPIAMPKWVFVILAYVNEYFYKLTHRVLVSKYLSSISLGYFSENSFSSVRTHLELGWPEMPPLEIIAQDIMRKYRAEQGRL